MSVRTTFVANQNNIHSGPGFLFVNALRPLYGMRPLLDGGNPPSLLDPPAPPEWTAVTAYTARQTVFDSNNNVQICTTAGTSGAVAPAWNTSAGGTTVDGSTLIWTLAGPPWTWIANSPAVLDQQIRDPNGNIQQCVVGGTTGVAEPTWSTIYGGATQDGAAEWQNYGPTLAAGAAEGAIEFQAQAKLMAVEADQFTAPIGQRLTTEEAKLTATLRELQMTTVARALPNTAYSSGVDPNFPANSQNYEMVTFGGLLLVPMPCLVLASPRPNYANPCRYVTGTLYKAAAASNGSLPFSLKKITDYKVDWTGNAVTWRPAGDQIGQIYRQI
jgi:hypothetical protein